ncbi:MAG: Holliday junction branch migration DNA helicase RuvB [Chlamydia sp.]
MPQQTERYIESLYSKRDEPFEANLRPAQFHDFVGQDRVKEQLQITIEATLKRNESLGHCLLSGPPGLGKTTLSHIIAQAVNSNIYITSGPALEKPIDLISELTKLQARDILFIDEIHRMPRVVEEYLYSAMEDFVIDIPQRARLPLEKFTLIGATTRPGLLTMPFRSRFFLTVRLEHYKEEDLKKIIARSSAVLHFDIDQDSIGEIARRSRGTPRIANKLLRWVRDYASIKEDGNTSELITKMALDMISIDEMGLDDLDFRILSSIVNLFDGGPVGLHTLASSIMEDPETIEEVHEPFLIAMGLIKKTTKGREATLRGRDHVRKQKNETISI